MKGRQRPLEPQFTFAGFTFPRYLAALPEGTKEQRRDSYKHTGGYYTAPTPNRQGWGFYLDENPMRWSWADEIDGARINHTGWFCGEYQDEKIRGLVVRLAHGRYLAGWSLGEGMASELEAGIYTDEIEAARAADRLAETTAEKEREYQEAEEERERQEEVNLGTDDEETTY